MQVALVIINNKDNQILLQHRGEGALTSPNKWGLWGGAVEKGETTLEAMKRELKEELSLDEYFRL